ncbi:MAG: hypothetical protein ACREOO_13665, partial [bacterium]
MVEVILQVTYIYMLTLLLALTIERMLEVLNAGWNFVEWRFNLHMFWTKRAQRLQEKFEQYAYSRLWRHFFDVSGLLFQLRKVRLEDQTGHSGIVPVISGDLVRNAVMVAANRTAAALLGILFCFLTQINLIAVVHQELKLNYKIITQMPVWLAIT